ncbi:hypothetical protein NPIL_310681 [Nephila pilipes]|uniref:Uncharacterized protein n=1 Tax=Nephila pilipes TaxID=299642 RepID=A0A8X6NB46_NEPPI|nr:hypothetical protein NPIL_310681 [Nephila pilipes]
MADDAESDMPRYYTFGRERERDALRFASSVRKSSHVDGRALWKKPTSDIARYYTVGRKRDALRFASRQLRQTSNSREGDAW